MVCDIAHNPDHICEAFQLELGSVNFFAWICSHCYANDIQLEGDLSTATQSIDPISHNYCLVSWTSLKPME